MKYLWVCLVLVALMVTALVAPVVLASGPAGAGPSDPLMVPTDSQTIAPNATLWFYFDYALESGSAARGGRGASRPKANVAVDANGVGGLQFGVYTPAQAADWLRDPTTQPVGYGTPYRDDSYANLSHDLYWSGAFNTSGRYLIAVTNTSNAAQVAFRLMVTGDAVQLYPPVVPSPTPTLPVPFTVTPIQLGTMQGKVVFETTTGGEIYAVNGDGSNLTKVSRGIDPTWSPDGKQIVFARWDNTNPGVFIANADGSNEQLVFAAPRIRWPRISPDGKYVVFAQDKSKSESNVLWKLGVVELATGKLTEPQCSQLCFVPSWGQDSATIVYTDPNIGIMATNAFKGGESLLGPTGSYWDSAANISRPILHWPAMQLSELSPDSTRIVYSMQAHDRWELNMMNSDGSGQTGITSPDPVQYYLLDIAVHNVAPTWSPDGQEILFLSDRNGKWEFFVTDPSGQKIRQVLKNVTDQVSVQFFYQNERIADWTR
ncbi:MAG: PD40 domain-containing protein [Chloroflexi bacterium]|nr:PD40 domain-containing protein [Chloroflexota bacterium]